MSRRGHLGTYCGSMRKCHFLYISGETKATKVMGGDFATKGQLGLKTDLSFSSMQSVAWNHWEVGSDIHDVSTVVLKVCT